MKTIGLIGGVASGKSFVAQEFARLGAVVLDADRAGHETLREPNILAAAKTRWGEAIIGPDGQIDRKRLAAIVFEQSPTGQAELSYLEHLTHSRIGERLQEQLVQADTKGHTVAVLDAPVLLKAGWDQFCDRIIFVDAPREVRLSRALARGWTEADFNNREAAQESLSFKAQRADDSIDNSGNVELTRTQVARLWRELSA
ncbi:MAG: dephospho-CoA kinase [Planctomycetaceae bacterium]|nr:dephospho-CoA kinase [Planctomycetaceae bacterium]